MYEVAPPTFTAPQRERCRKFGLSRCVDIHCHCLPGLDDGPDSWQAAIALCRALVSDGITTVTATPHQLGGYDRLNSAAVVRETVKQLTAQLDDEGIALEVAPGGDVRLDERLLKLLDADEVVTAADAGRHVLLELPRELFLDPLPIIHGLRERGIQPVITHPERYPYLRGSITRQRTWIAAGAALQITAGSLMGDFGRRAMDAAWSLVGEGCVSLVATDAHDVSRRPPRMTAAIAALEREAGADVARLICGENPLRVLRGQEVFPPTLF